LITTPSRHNDQRRPHQERSDSGEKEGIGVAAGMGHRRSEFLFQLCNLVLVERAEIDHLGARIDHFGFDLRERLTRLDLVYRRR
jgi:hypothetical protein